MAHALEVPKTCYIEPKDDYEAQEIILSAGKSLGYDFLDINRMKGVLGNFYRENRKEDMILIIHNILNERNEGQRLCVE